MTDPTHGEALAVAGQVLKEIARRQDRVEDDLYGREGLRVQVTQTAEIVRPIPGQLEEIRRELHAIRTAPQPAAQVTVSVDRDTFWSKAAEIGARYLIVPLAAIVGWFTRHFGWHP